MGDGTGAGTIEIGGQPSSGRDERRLTVRYRENPLKKKARTVARSMTKQLVPKPDNGVGALSYVARRLEGGKTQFAELARLSDGPAAKAFVLEWDSYSPSKRQNTSLDLVCDRIGASPGELLAEVVKGAFEVNTDVSRLLLAVAQPRILQKAAKNALLQKGFRDREMLLQASGLVPKGGGGIHLSANAQAVAAAKAEAVTEGSGLPKFDQQMRQTAELIRLREGQATNKAREDGRTGVLSDATESPPCTMPT